MSTVIYAWLLSFYPDDLRREYGDEMALVFGDELRSRGALRVWWNAFSEFLRIALPHTLSRPAFRVPLIGMAFSVLCMLSEFAMSWVRQAPPRFSIFASLPSFAPVILPVLVIWACRGSAVTSLDLKER